ncbi:MAG: alpha/beta hydrolase [bacterium]|nr:alpha/beta hydrolase [bacterium]
MKTAIILHGMPSKEEYFSPEGGPSQHNKHWLPWIQHQLLLKGVLAQILELPEPYEPDYEKWRSVFEQFKIDENTSLVGHSCGGGFLVRWLSENKVNVGRVALIAPWIDPTSTSVKPGFFDFQIDENLAERTGGICLFISSDDSKEELDTAKLLREKVRGLEVKEFSDKGHFTFNSMGTEVFPELRDFLAK